MDGWVDGCGAAGRVEPTVADVVGGGASGSFIALCWSPAAWCLRNEGVSSVLLGASNTDQLMENIGAIQVSSRHACTRFLFFFACLRMKFRPNANAGSALVPPGRSSLSWVRRGLMGSLPLHAPLLYCTALIRSEEYQLPRGSETRPQPLLLPPS